MNGKCEATIHNNWKTYQCKNKSKMEFEGKNYCGIHDPIKKKLREKAEMIEYEREMEIEKYKRLAFKYCQSKRISLEDLQDFALSMENEK